MLTTGYKHICIARLLSSSTVCYGSEMTNLFTQSFANHQATNNNNTARHTICDDTQK